MPTKNRPENELIKLFLSAYENDTWRGCEFCRLDEEYDGAVEVIATRKSDRRTLAIEHTLIRPYGEFKTEFARLNNYGFRSIEEESLVPPGRWVRVYIEAGEIRVGRDWHSLKTVVHDWLRRNLVSIPAGDTNVVIATPDNHDCRLLLRVKEGLSISGGLRLGIDGAKLPDTSLYTVVEKALGDKLPKLVHTEADFHILLLERNEFTLAEKQIWSAINSLQPKFPLLKKVSQIWFLETTFYERDRIVDFWLFDDQGMEKASLNFMRGELQSRTPY